MKNKLKILTAISLLCFTSESFGDVKIVNYTDDNIQIFFRGKGSTKHHTEALAAKGHASYDITPDYIDNRPTFEAIASTGVGGDPDWKLLGGTCKNLTANKNYILLIEKTVGGLKTSCTTIEK